MFEFKGKQYQIKKTILNPNPKLQLEQLNYLVNTSDFNTLTNRITNGVKYGWLKVNKNGRI